MVAKLGMTEKAMMCADRALALDPNFVEAYLCKAAAARALGRTEIVSEVSEALSRIKPENFRPAR